MNELDILMKTKEILGDYVFLCQNTNISIPDFMAARREAIFELQTPGYRENDDALCHSPSMPGMQRFHPFTGNAENSSTAQGKQNFDPFTQLSAPPSQTASSTEKYRLDPADDHAAEMSVTITNGHPTGNFGQPPRESQKDVTEDPFFSMIKKIKD